MPTTAPYDLSVSVAGSADDAVLHRLAALDSAEEPPARPVLIAEVGGRPCAAISIREGTVVADPFEPTAAVADLLRMRVAQVRGRDERPVHPRSRLHRIVALSRRARPVPAPRPVPAR
jgi:hypothetical protein